jgi:hypothetical protein
VNTNAAPTPPPIPHSPISAVVPLLESATLQPKNPGLPPPVSFEPSWVQVVPERVNAHAAPSCSSSF